LIQGSICQQRKIEHNKRCEQSRCRKHLRCHIAHLNQHAALPHALHSRFRPPLHSKPTRGSGKPPLLCAVLWSLAKGFDGSS